MSKTDRAAEVDKLAGLIRKFFPFIPFNAALGVEIIDLGDGYAIQRLPYSPELVGDPETGVLHGGAITTLLDSVCGAAAFMAMATPENLATLDLRIDYLKPATPGEAVIGRAECLKRTRQVIFIRCMAYHSDPSDPIAMGTASFVTGTPRNLSGTRRSS